MAEVKLVKSKIKKLSSRVELETLSKEVKTNYFKYNMYLT